jgi:protein SCO1
MTFPICGVKVSAVRPKIMRSIPFALSLFALSLFTSAFTSAFTSRAFAQTPRMEDAAVLTHDGRTVHFYTDLVKGRLTAINFIFTSCTTVCPLMGVRFAQLQPLLPNGVTLISVSIDPTNDTPELMAAWAKRVGAKPGWTLVTGEKPDVETLLRSLGTTSVDYASHTPLVLIVDDRAGRQTSRRVDGLTDPKTLARLIRELSR